MSVSRSRIRRPSDLETGVPAARDEDRSPRDVAGIPVADAVRLEDLRCQPTGELRHVWRLERPGGDDNLLGLDRPAVDLEEKLPSSPLSRRTGLFSSIGSSNVSA
jgi:hypothetical protein